MNADGPEEKMDGVSGFQRMGKADLGHYGSRMADPKLMVSIVRTGTDLDLEKSFDIGRK